MKERKNLAEGEIKMITANIIYLAEKENKSKTAYFKDHNGKMQFNKTLHKYVLFMCLFVLIR